MWRERAAFLVVIGMALFYAAVASASFPDRARLFPQLVALAGLVIVGAELARMSWTRRARYGGGTAERDTRSGRGGVVEAPDEAGAMSALAQLRAGAPFMAWIVGYYGVIWLVGFAVASIAFLVAFLILVAHVAPRRAMLAALPVVLLLALLHRVLDVRWPEGRLALPVAMGQTSAAARPEPYPEAVLFARDLMIPMRDGVRLATDIYRPAVNGRVVAERLPVLFLRTPYDKRDRGARPEVAYFARHGYVVAVQDSRGRYASEGVFRKYFDHDATDGYDSIEHLARLPYALPAVAMWGTSYSAHAIADAAKLAPPSLKAAIVNEGGMSSAWEQTVRSNGAFEVGRQLTWAWRQLEEETTDPVVKAMLRAEPVERWYSRLPLRRGLSPLSVDTVVENYYLDMATRADYDGYWRTIGQEWKPYYARTADIPMLHVGGWYDIYTQTTVDNFLGLSAVKRAPISMMIGPWTHGADMPSRTWAGEVDFGPAAAIEDFAGRFHLEFFDHHIKGRRTPAAGAPRVRVFVMGGGDGRRDEQGRLRHGGRWRDADRWPLPGTVLMPFYFHADGGLDTGAPRAAASSTTWTFDPAHPVPTIGGGVSARLTDGAFDQRERPELHGSRPPYLPVRGRSDVVVFQTPPLEEDVEVVGPITVVLHVSSSAVDTDFTAKLVDVYPASADYPSGFDLNLTDGIVRASYRNGRHARSLLVPGETYEIRFDLYPTANLFRRGHRIRVDISSSNFPRFDVNPNTGEPPGLERRAVRADNTLHHSVGRSSHVVLPVMSGR